VHSSDPRLRIGILLALRRTRSSEGRASLPQFLADQDPEVRRAAIQWVGEDKLHEYAALAKASASRAPVTRELFEAYLATLDYLYGRKRKPDDEPSGDQFIAPLLKDPSQPPAIRLLALRMIRADHPALDTSLLRRLLADKEPGTRLEAIRILATRTDSCSYEMLCQVAGDRNADRRLRAYAVLGLANSDPSLSRPHLLFELLNCQDLAREAIRSLRGVKLSPVEQQQLLDWWVTDQKRNEWPKDLCRELAGQMMVLISNDPRPDVKKTISRLGSLLEPRPKTEARWRLFLVSKADAEWGGRIFFHPRGPRFFACHRVDGRGAAIGPDLSYVGRSTSREKLIESILVPSKEIAPQFTS